MPCASSHDLRTSIVASDRRSTPVAPAAGGADGGRLVATTSALGPQPAMQRCALATLSRGLRAAPYANRLTPAPRPVRVLAAASPGSAGTAGTPTDPLPTEQRRYVAMQAFARQAARRGTASPQLDAAAAAAAGAAAADAAAGTGRRAALRRLLLSGAAAAALLVAAAYPRPAAAFKLPGGLFGDGGSPGGSPPAAAAAVDGIQAKMEDRVRGVREGARRTATLIHGRHRAAHGLNGVACSAATCCRAFPLFPPPPSFLEGSPAPPPSRYLLLKSVQSSLHTQSDDVA